MVVGKMRSQEPPARPRANNRDRLSGKGLVECPKPSLMDGVLLWNDEDQRDGLSRVERHVVDKPEPPLDRRRRFDSN